MRPKQTAYALLLFLAGIACGGYLFSKSEPRSFLAAGSCQDRCYKPNEIAGLVMSAAILRAPFLIPGVVLESDTCLAIRHPMAHIRIHYVLFPKHDTRSITTLTPADSPYVLGCFALVRELVFRDKLQAYRLYTNGPGYQEIAYLHFHLIAE
ncbi:MAG: HIT domain-containing protein [Methylococcales bacterium]|nr:HIT domain-containing protein [Methylococcales bacterium]